MLEIDDFRKEECKDLLRKIEAHRKNNSSILDDIREIKSLINNDVPDLFTQMFEFADSYVPTEPTIPNVYFIFCPSNGLVKIGKSVHNPLRRLAALKSLSPEKLEMLGWVCKKEITELSLHRKFKKHLSHGEWFEDCLDIRKFIKENCQREQRP